MDGPKYYTNDNVYWGKSYWSIGRQCGPALIRNDGSVYFVTDSEKYRNRKNGPAVIYPDGSIFYKLGGEFHRVDGPAIINADGNKDYYVDGIPLSQLEFFTTYGVM